MQSLIRITILLALPILFSVSVVASDEDLVKQLRALPMRKVPPKNTELYDQYRYRFWPLVVQDLQSGRIIVDLERVKNELLPELKSLGMIPDELLLEVDGGASQGGRDIPLEMKILDQETPFFIYQGGPTNRQQYVRVAIKSKGKFIHVSDNGLIQKTIFPKINPKAYADFPEPKMNLPGYLTTQGAFDTNMVSLAGKIQHKNVVFAVSKDCANKPLVDAFFKYGPDLHPMPIKDRAGNWVGWNVHVPGHGKPLRAGLNDVQVKGGAAFSQHTFFWDDHLVAISRANNDPAIALQTLAYWINSQLPDGAIGRELDYKGTSYERPINVKFGKSQVSLDFFNPPIEGWAWHEIARWSPESARPYLARIVDMIHKHRGWLAGLAVRESNGEIVGFRWSNMASGRDNAPRPLDASGLDTLSLFGIRSDVAPGREKRGLAVDLLAQYKMLGDHESEILQHLGRFDEAMKLKSESAKLSQVLNKRYFSSKLGWYVDLVPSGRTDWVQAPIVTLAGFWPVAAKAPLREQVGRMIQEYLENPKKFGGLFPPSIPKDNPYYDERGRYWQGGGWPVDWEMVSRALFEYGFRAEAAILTQRELSAITVASKAFADGETPLFMLEQASTKPGFGTQEEHVAALLKIDQYRKNFFNGKIFNPKASGEGTVFEVYGIRRNEAGEPVATYGVSTIPENNVAHLTRFDFGGWGSLVPLRSVRYIVGLDATPRFFGEKRDLVKWLHSFLTTPDISYHQVTRSPAFKGLSRWLSEHPDASFEQFKGVIRPNEINEQLDLLSKGVVEISPTFDPEQGTTKISNFVYDGIRFTLAIDRLPDGTIRISVDSPKRLRMQFGQSWKFRGLDSKPTDDLAQSTKIFEVGGDRKSVLIRNGELLTGG